MEYSPEDKRLLLEYVEAHDDCPDSFMDFYIKERRDEYYDEWFEFLEVLDRE